MPKHLRDLLYGSIPAHAGKPDLSGTHWTRLLNAGIDLTDVPWATLRAVGIDLAGVPWSEMIDAGVNMSA